LAVHEDQVVVAGLDGFEGFQAVGGDIGGEAEALEMEEGYLAVDGIIFDDEEAGGRGERGEKRVGVEMRTRGMG
jgi:hypothetical protein